MNPILENLGKDKQIQQGGHHRRSDGLKADLDKAHHFLVQQGGKARTLGDLWFQYGLCLGLARTFLRNAPTFQVFTLAHAINLSFFSSCIMRTKSSSRSVLPTLASSACGVSRSTISPSLSMAIRLQSASASSR